jgi:hypothetical protein
VVGIYAAEKAREGVRRRAKEREAAQRERSAAAAKADERKKTLAKQKKDEEGKRGSRSRPGVSIASVAKMKGDASKRARAVSASEAARAKNEAEKAKLRKERIEREDRDREEAAEKVKFEIARKERALAEEKQRARLGEERAASRVAGRAHAGKTAGGGDLKNASTLEETRRTSRVGTPGENATPSSRGFPLESPRVLLEQAKAQMNTIVALASPRPDVSEGSGAPPRRGDDADASSRRSPPQNSSNVQKLEEKKQAKLQEKIAAKRAAKRAARSDTSTAKL